MSILTRPIEKMEEKKRSELYRHPSPAFDLRDVDEHRDKQLQLSSRNHQTRFSIQFRAAFVRATYFELVFRVQIVLRDKRKPARRECEWSVGSTKGREDSRVPPCGAVRGLTLKLVGEDDEGEAPSVTTGSYPSSCCTDSLFLMARAASGWRWRQRKRREEERRSSGQLIRLNYFFNYIIQLTANVSLSMRTSPSTKSN
jgi:hypothetical protein